MLHFVGCLFLLSWTSVCVHSNELVDANLLLYEVFRINRNDSKFMDDLWQLFVGPSGDVDKVAYDKELKRTNPSLHDKMVVFRRMFIETNNIYPTAANFINILWTTARDARNREIFQPEETKVLWDNFNSLSQKAKEYLTDKLPALRLLDSSTQKPPSGVVTPAPSIIPTSRTTAPTPSKPSTELEKVINELEGAIKTISSPLSQAVATIVDDLKRMQNPVTPWEPTDFKLLFRKIGRADELVNDCTYAICKEAVINSLANALEYVFKRAVEAEPHNWRLIKSSDDYNFSRSNPTVNLAFLHFIIKYYSREASA